MQTQSRERTISRLGTNNAKKTSVWDICHNNYCTKTSHCFGLNAVVLKNGTMQPNWPIRVDPTRPQFLAWLVAETPPPPLSSNRRRISRSFSNSLCLKQWPTLKVNECPTHSNLPDFCLSLKIARPLPNKLLLTQPNNPTRPHLIRPYSNISAVVNSAWDWLNNWYFHLIWPNVNLELTKRSAHKEAFWHVRPPTSRLHLINACIAGMLPENNWLDSASCACCSPEELWRQIPREKNWLLCRKNNHTINYEVMLILPPRDCHKD